MDDRCDTCQIGILRPTRATYTRLINGTLIQAPNAPARRCDVCGEVVFALEVEQRIELLVGEGGPPPNEHAEEGARRPDSPASADDAAVASPPSRKL